MRSRPRRVVRGLGRAFLYLSIYSIYVVSFAVQTRAAPTRDQPAQTTARASRRRLSKASHTHTHSTQPQVNVVSLVPTQRRVVSLHRHLRRWRSDARTGRHPARSSRQQHTTCSTPSKPARPTPPPHYRCRPHHRLALSAWPPPLPPADFWQPTCWEALTQPSRQCHRHRRARSQRAREPPQQQQQLHRGQEAPRVAPAERSQSARPTSAAAAAAAAAAVAAATAVAVGHSKLRAAPKRRGGPIARRLNPNLTRLIGSPRATWGAGDGVHHSCVECGKPIRAHGVS